VRAAQQRAAQAPAAGWQAGLARQQLASASSAAQQAAAAHRGVFQRITALFSYMKAATKHM